MSVHISSNASIFTVVLDRPERRNAIDGATTAALRAAFDEFESNDELLVGVLTGAGDTFCSGADLRAGPAGEAIRDEHGLGSFSNRVRRKPVIAAVEGFAYAGGFEIVLACDLVVASRVAKFALPEVRRGVMAGPGLWRLPRNIGFATAALIALTGEPIEATRAYELGLVSTLVEPGTSLDVATELAMSIAANAPEAVRETLGLMRESQSLNDDDAIVLSRRALGRLSKTADFMEGPRAFTEGRPPKWLGR